MTPNKSLKAKSMKKLDAIWFHLDLMKTCSAEYPSDEFQQPLYDLFLLNSSFIMVHLLLYFFMKPYLSLNIKHLEYY